MAVYARFKEKPKKFKLEILDSEDKVIRAFDKLKAAEGLNRFTWDLTHEPPEKIQGAIISLSNTRGPRAVPGKYAVRLTVGEESLTQPFEVLKDPRWENISVADLQEQFDLQVEAGKAFTLSHDLIKDVREIRTQVKDISSRAEKAGYSEDVKKAAEELNKKLTALEEELIQTKNESSQDPINYQVKLDNQLAYVYSSASSQDSKPNHSIRERYEELKAQLDKAVETFQSLEAGDLKNFEKLLQDNDIPRIIYKEKK
jgi:hypothetical protein